MNFGMICLLSLFRNKITTILYIETYLYVINHTCLSVSVPASSALDKLKRTFDPCVSFNFSTIFNVLLHNAWPILRNINKYRILIYSKKLNVSWDLWIPMGSKKTNIKSDISPNHNMAVLTSNGYFMSPSTSPGVSMNVIKLNCFCLLVDISVPT